MADELRTGQEKFTAYTVIDNRNGVHYIHPKDDEEALEYMKEHYDDYVVMDEEYTKNLKYAGNPVLRGILFSQSIVLVRPNGYILAYINTFTGEQTVKLMSDWIK